MEEIGLFFKLLPRCTYVMETEGKRNVRGIKEIKEKDRATAFLWTTEGSVKVDLRIIGKEKNPPYFRIGRPDIVFFSQKNSLADNVALKRWFFKTFIPHFLTTTLRPVAFIIDNSGPHRLYLVASRGQINIFPIPTNCTTTHQPINLGVIVEWKKLYRRNLW